jgi:HAD superfamily hydrolase (TIGR01509 family)
MSDARDQRSAAARTLKLVIFDCDGVLVDSEPISNAVLVRALDREGLRTTAEQSRRDHQGLLLEDIVARAETKLGRRLPEDWAARFERDRAEVFHRELQPIPGVAEAVERAQAAGLAVCVASQGKLEKTRLSLELTGLRHLFADDALFSAYEVPRGKPFPDLFLQAAATMGVSPSQSVVVEDTPSGVQAAVAAEMRVLGYAADSDEAPLRAAGAETFHSMQELPALLGFG